MTITSEFYSWLTPSNPETAEPPKIGQPAPITPLITLEPNKRTIITFLRHCGCPFAEKTFIRIREAAKIHRDIDFIAVSHSAEKDTQTWLSSLPQHGSEPGNLRIIVDSEKEAYSAWGLGVSGWAHILDPRALSSVYTLSKEGISNRPTESGSRWQTAGSFAVSEDGMIKWGGPARRSDDIADFDEAVQALEK
ncbi:uncharacterized protein RCC_05822 [Ramularia collo-cygni]|uniref:Thioredoxin domain-containing protein n=1 Tax=Ramularia collo-cygni TaxID=112498 RepID=A0A2D3UZT3_9PEZI|nr:uncharacterized protein RCC_05822 [Ramularia collo-cygni]CZT19965.1 uncharacterized protein RCC_05822 [Ramularia collo-cygni]